MDATSRRPDGPLSFESTAVHAGRYDLTELGVHVPPIDLSTTSPLGTVEAGRDAYDAFAGGGVPITGHSTVYRRAWNTTVARFEEAVAALEGHVPGGPALDVHGVAFASGMAAITAVLMSRVAAGKPHVVAIRPLYGGTDGLLASGLLGTDVSYVDVEHLAAAITDRTGLVVLETPSNPTLDLRDIRAVADIAGYVPVMVDNTFATPVLQQPLRHGATFVVHSATKYLGGHGDAMGGVVVTTPEHAAAIRPIRIITGGVLDPWTGYLLHRGLSTLAVRVRAQQDTAGRLAAWLTDQPRIEQVFYPGLPGADTIGVLGRQMTGPGAMVAFAVRGGFDAAASICARVRLITHAVSLGGTDTLVEHPAALTHRIVTPEAQPAEGVLRISVGLESADDLIADLAQAMA